MTQVRSPFMAPRGLRNPHVQTMLGSSGFRGLRARHQLVSSGATHETVIIDAGEGVRLQGVRSIPRNAATGTLVLLLHGWEGSVDSNYMRMAAVELLRAGFAVFRLNFRDHGDSHHLNPEIFHSARIDEVLRAAHAVVEGNDVRELHVAGYSLGGNFAMRVALNATAAGLPLGRTLAVCPPLDPAHTMRWMEDGWPPYLHYFEHKWRRSLRRKRALFPELHDIADEVLHLPMRALTEWLVQRHTDFADIDEYFRAYRVTPDALAACGRPVEILMTEDDPVIPLDDFRTLDSVPNVRLELARHGGHCGFLRNWRLDGYSEAWLAERLRQA